MLSPRFNVTERTRKRLFIGLLSFSLLILILVLLASIWLLRQRSLLLNRIILVAVISCVTAAFFVLSVGLLALIWSLWRSKTYPSLQNIMATATNFLFPFALHLGKWLGWDEEKIKNSYIQVSNQLVKARSKSHPAKKVMLLAPHCLQWSGCPYKITMDVRNCQGCGKCPVTKLRELAERYGVDLAIATGGTFARKFIKDKRPDAVVAIACERDLTSGIQDIVKIPVMGVVNERPHGPCANTSVDLEKAEEAIKYFINGG